MQDIVDKSGVVRVKIEPVSDEKTIVEKEVNEILPRTCKTFDISFKSKSFIMCIPVAFCHKHC